MPQTFGAICRSTETMDEATVKRALIDKNYIEKNADRIKDGSLRIGLDKTMPGELQPRI